MTAAIAALLLAPVFAHPPEFHRLDNGLRVVFVEDHAVPWASIQVWYAVGGADDARDQPGLAEVCRRRLLGRQAADPPAAFASRTLRDACYFAWLVPAEGLEAVLRTEAERLGQAGGSTSPGPENAAAREPERRDTAIDRALAALLPDHPYGRPPDVVSSAANAADNETVSEFMRRWFVPGNATLFIIGDMQPVRVLETVRRHFGALPWTETPRRLAWDWPTAERVCPPGLDGAAGVTLAWLAPAASSPDGAALDVLLHSLCNPVDGALCLQLAERGCPPPVWRRESWRLSGMVVLGVPAGRQMATDEVAGLVEDALRQAAETLPDDILMQRARKLAARDVRQARDEFGAWALRLVWHEMIGGDLLRAERELPLVERLHVGDFQRAARLLLEARAVVLPGCGNTGNEPEVPTVATPAMPVPATTELALPGGVRGRVVVQRWAETARVRTLVAGPPGLGAAMRAVVRTGSADWTVDHFRDYLTFRGLDLYPLDEGDEIGLVSSGPAALVAQMIELHARLLRTPGRDAAVYERAVAQAETLRAALAALPHDEAGRIYVPPGAIGWHAAWPVAGTAAELRASLSALVAIQGVTLIVESPLEPAAVQAAAEACWGDWAPPASQPSPPAQPGL